MVGRAGRAGMGETGEAFLLCKRCDTQKVSSLCLLNINYNYF